MHGIPVYFDQFSHLLALVRYGTKSASDKKLVVNDKITSLQTMYPPSVAPKGTDNRGKFRKKIPFRAFR